MSEELEARIARLEQLLGDTVIPNLNAFGQSVEADLLELSAQVNTHRLLLEFVLANMFAGDVPGLGKVMNELEKLSLESSTTSEPASEEAKNEVLVRGTVHLQRIHASVRSRIQSGRVVRSD